MVGWLCSKSFQPSVQTVQIISLLKLLLRAIYSPSEDPWRGFSGRRHFFQQFLASDGSPPASGSAPSGVPEPLLSRLPFPREFIESGPHRAAPQPLPPPAAPGHPRAPHPEPRGGRSGAARSRGAGQGGQSPLPSGRLRRVAAPLSISLTSLPHALCFQYYTPAASWCLCFAASRERGRHCRCGCGWANARAAGRGAALSGAERSGEERSGAASLPPAPAVGSPGAAPRLGPAAPRWSLPRGSLASCSAARSACPPLPRGVPGTEVGARRVPLPSAASGLLASPWLRRPVPGSPPVSSRGCEPRGLPLLSNFYGRFCRVSSCERRARTRTGMGTDTRTGARSVVPAAVPQPPLPALHGARLGPGVPGAGRSARQLVRLLLLSPPRPPPPSQSTRAAAGTAAGCCPRCPRPQPAHPLRAAGISSDTRPLRACSPRAGSFPWPPERSRHGSAPSEHLRPAGKPRRSPGAALRVSRLRCVAGSARSRGRAGSGSCPLLWGATASLNELCTLRACWRTECLYRAVSVCLM